jgi:hypothetical protein
MKSILILLSVGLALGSVSDAFAAKKSKQHRRSDFTPAQQKKFFEQSRARCQKEYGAQFERVEVDYFRWRYICYIH